MSSQTVSLSELENASEFEARHIGPSASDQYEMLATLNFSDRNQMIDAVVPHNIRNRQILPLGEFENARTEQAALDLLQSIAQKNKLFRTWIGQGYYNTFTPNVIQRNILENPAWYTAYTPYQPEISQGRLEAIINFQQAIIDLTGMDIANASMLDESTAAAEAMTLAQRTCSSQSNNFFVADDVFPQTIAVIKTRAKPLGIHVIVAPIEQVKSYDCFGALIQYPGGNGKLMSLDDYQSITDQIHTQGGIVIAAADLLSLCIIASPKTWNADIVVGSAQRFGIPLGFGGPHAGYLANKDALKRNMPGRLVGVTIDSSGKPAYRLALQTREQHIRREKATSNICTAQVLLAVMAGMYAVFHGPEGLERIAQRTHRLSVIFTCGIKQLGFELEHTHWFDTIQIRTNHAVEIYNRALEAGINLRLIDSNNLCISFDETSSRMDLENLWQIFGAKPGQFNCDELDNQIDSNIPNSLCRTDKYLTHPSFNRYHAEHEMLRYIRSLADKDLALDRTMIPLGSCTMKLNATSEMLPISWPLFNQIHPFSPREQWAGYAQLIEQTEEMLCAATGYSAISLQPNAGSQGEYAGLLVIQAYHASREESHRNICLIPSSAHGTNPASAQMAGMEVVVVACDVQGNVDISDLKNKAQTHSNNLAALMITYPSTHGVFEEAITTICEIIHQHGGQVYIDGANMNALVGTAAPGKFGGDVSHLNLHKTFCIPHGGGGPGVGPVAVREHLAPFLPTSFTAGTAIDIDNPHVPRISGAPFGSASILPISWMYVAMMGSAGLKAATEVAILAANYIAKKLEAHYPVLYTGLNGLVAHECILDLRPLQKISGISNEDVAKRLMDFGFHAPTMSFPVPGTLMIEPTESESKAELDRFIEAMICIRHEIEDVIQARIDKEDNPLKNAPHTAEIISSETWDHPYSRTQAAFPVKSLIQRKYWPPVGRADNVYGDRNLFCSCIPLEDYSTN